jgi:hypothetical protein
LGRALDNTLIGGSNLRYPLGKNADYAAMRIREFIPLIKVMISENDNETAQITTAKILSNILTYREDAQKKNVPFPEGKFIKAENSWLNSDYVNSLEICAEIAKDILPTTYPEQQTIPADYTQIRKTLDSVTDPIVEHGGNFIDLFPQ